MTKMTMKMVEDNGKVWARIIVETPEVGRASVGLRKKIDALRKAGWVVEKGKVGKYGAYWAFNSPFGLDAMEAMHDFNVAGRLKGLR